MPASRRCAIAVQGLLWLLIGGCSGTRMESQLPPLAVSGSTVTLEIAPVLLAARDHYAPGATVSNGGIGNLVGAGTEGQGDDGPADLATHAETQALRYSLAHPDLRIIATVTQGHYRIVARRSAGIVRLADLKGKRVATLATTSAGYFLSRMLAQVDLGFSDIHPVRISPIESMATALARREVDAVAIWEPHAGDAAHILGHDAIEFPGNGIYRELFNLNSTAAHLADPSKRRAIVAFVRAVMMAAEAVRRDPAPAQRLVATTAGLSPEAVSRAWPTLDFSVSLPPDLLDVLVAEEQWLAKQEGRVPRTREALAQIIDTTVLEEAARP